MDVPERPQDIKDRLLDLFRLIDKGDINGARELRQQLAKEIGTDEPEFVSADGLIDKGDINGARELRQQLAKEIGTDEPEFVSADVLIRRREILNR